MWWDQRRGIDIRVEINSEIGGESERRGWFLKHRGREAESEWESLRVYLGTTYLVEAEKFLLKVLKKGWKISWIVQWDPWIVAKNAKRPINSSKN